MYRNKSPQSFRLAKENAKSKREDIVVKMRSGAIKVQLVMLLSWDRPRRTFEHSWKSHRKTQWK